MESIIFYLDDRPELRYEMNERLSEILSVTPTSSKIHIQVFSDGEVCVDYHISVRGKRVFIVSSPNNSDKLMQLNLAIDAAKRASAKEIIPIIPYFPYARQDKKDQVRGPIGAKVVAEMIENRGATQVITLDLHADQIQGFFNIPVTHLEGKFLFDDKIKEIYDDNGGDIVLCSPDAGGAKRVKGVRDRLKDKYVIDIPMVMIDKTRSEANKVDEMVLIGDVSGKHVIIIDDMADTCGTLVKASENLIEMGAKSVSSIVTHGILSGQAINRLYKAIRTDKVLKEFICSDSLEINNDKTFTELKSNYVLNDGNLVLDRVEFKPKDFITQITVSGQIAKAIKAIIEHKSIEDLKKGS